MHWRSPVGAHSWLGSWGVHGSCQVAAATATGCYIPHQQQHVWAYSLLSSPAAAAAAAAAAPFPVLGCAPLLAGPSCPVIFQVRVLPM